MAEAERRPGWGSAAKILANNYPHPAHRSLRARCATLPARGRVGMNRIPADRDYGKTPIRNPAMCSLRHFAQLLSATPSSLRAGLLGFGLAFAATDPSLAGGTGVDCVLGSKESPLRVIATCSAMIENPATSRADRAAALVVQADARARTSAGVNQALADVDRAIELD